MRASQKLIAKDESRVDEFNKNLNALIAIRDDSTIEDTLRIMAMNTINTMLDGVIEDKGSKPEPSDILKKIRSKKK